MTTKKQIAANRRNAQKSTGPRTEAGKQRSRLNALKHGLRASLPVLPGEDPEQLDNLRETLRDSCRPTNGLEEILVAQMADAEWRRQRFNRAETGLFYYRQCVEAPPFYLAERNCSHPPQTPEERDLFTLGRNIQYLTGENNHLDSLSRYESTARRAFFQALKAFIGQRQFPLTAPAQPVAEGAATLPDPAPALMPPRSEEIPPNEAILAEVPIKRMG